MHPYDQHLPSYQTILSFHCHACKYFCLLSKTFLFKSKYSRRRKNWPSSPKMRIIECMSFLCGLRTGCRQGGLGSRLGQGGLGSHLGTSPALFLHCSFRLTSAVFCRQPKATILRLLYCFKKYLFKV